VLKRNAEILLLQRILKSGCDFASAGSQKNKCDLAFAEDQHINKFK